MNYINEAKMLTGSYIARLAGHEAILDGWLDQCADENGYRTKHLTARRALIASERALQGIRVTKNAVWSNKGDFTAVVKYEGAPAMDANGHLGLTLELLVKAEELLSEYIQAPTAANEELPIIEAFREWVRCCHWDLSALQASPKPSVIHAPNTVADR